MKTVHNLLSRMRREIDAKLVAYRQKKADQIYEGGCIESVYMAVQGSSLDVSVKANIIMQHSGVSDLMQTIRSSYTLSGDDDPAEVIRYQFMVLTTPIFEDNNVSDADKWELGDAVYAALKDFYRREVGGENGIE